MKSTIIIVLLALLTAGFGYFLYDRHTEKVAVQETAKHRDDAEQQVREAILNQRVIPGMTGYQVKQSWGEPIRIGNGNEVRETLGKNGVSALWLYSAKRGFLLMDLNSTVLYVMSYTDQPQLLDYVVGH